MRNSWVARFRWPKEVLNYPNPEIRLECPLCVGSALTNRDVVEYDLSRLLNNYPTEIIGDLFPHLACCQQGLRPVPPSL
jgi:hypothetical protein